MLKIGLTGGIGSGKSVVAEILRIQGIPVYNADERAKYLNENAPEIRQQLTHCFGENIYENGKLNKPFFAQILFSNPDNLRIANSIIHPVLAADFERWAVSQKTPIVVMEAAILLEAGFERIFDKIITVVAPETLRLQRASIRDNVSEDKITQRAQHQLSDAEKIKRADYVIHNDNEHSLLEQIFEIIDNLTKEE